MIYMMKRNRERERERERGRDGVNVVGCSDVVVVVIVFFSEWDCASRFKTGKRAAG